MAIPEKVKKAADRVRGAIYGGEVQESIANGLEATGEIADEANGISKKVETDFKALQQEYTENGNGAQSSAEIIAARDGKPVLADRLKRDFGNVTAQLARTMTQTEFDSWVATLLDGGPSIFMDSLAALNLAYPTGSSGIALVRETDPAKIYVWNGTNWQYYGAYQGIEIKEGAVTPAKTTFLNRESINVFDAKSLKLGDSYNILSITNGVVITKELAPKVPFTLNLDNLTNKGKGTQILKAGKWYLKYKSKSTNGNVGVGSGIFPPRLHDSNGVRNNFVKLKGENSTSFTEWIWEIDLSEDAVNYGLLFQNGDFAETYTMFDFMITQNKDDEYEDYYTYYPTKNIKSKEYKSLKKDVDVIKRTILHGGLIGDSLTEGDYGSVTSGVPNLQTLNYPYFFKNETGYTTTNFGKSGWTTKQVWDGIVKTMSLSSNYNFFIIMLGTNGGLTDTIEIDCTAEEYNLYADTQTGSYCKIIEHLMINCPSAQIFLCTPPFNDKEGKREYIEETGEVVKKIGKKYNVTVIDLYGELGVNRLNKSVFLPIDSLHFGEFGYQKLGTFIANQVMSRIGYYGK